MKLAICEDKEEDREKMAKICREILSASDTPWELMYFSDGKEVLSCKEEPDILILDIEMEKINGIQVKDQFQSWNKKTMLLFVTAHDEMMREAFGLNVFGFIPKEKMEVHLKEMLPKLLGILQSYVMINGEIDSREVIYVKVERVYSCLVTEDGSEHLIRDSLSHLEKLLKPVGFVRIHKSYLVNAKWVAKWREGEVVTCKGTLPVSVRMRAKAKKQYDSYCMEHAAYCAKGVL